MVRRERGPTNPIVSSLIIDLRKASVANEVKIWRAVSERLKKPRRNRPEVNLSKINRYSEADDFVLVPGKVLGAGELEHPVTVAALSVSQAARDKIEASNGKVITIPELVELKPKGTGVKIMG